MAVTYDQVLAWRLRQQGLAPRSSASVEQVVERFRRIADEG